MWEIKNINHIKKRLKIIKPHQKGKSGAGARLKVLDKVYIWIFESLLNCRCLGSCCCDFGLPFRQE